jgi:divalent metal cation (Fe/Co/Zn/Cd) transporter
MKEIVNDILSSPFGLVLETILGIIILVVIVLSRTKFGRKLLFALMDRIANSEKKIDKQIEELKKDKEEMQKQHEDTIKKYELEMAKKEKEYAFVEKFLLDTLGNINNVKVKTAVESYEKLKAEYLTDNDTKIVESEQKD